MVVPANYLLGQLDPERAVEYYSAIFQHKFAEFIRPGSFMSSKDISVTAYRLSRLLLEKRGDGEEVQRYLKIASDLGDKVKDRVGAHLRKGRRESHPQAFAFCDASSVEFSYVQRNDMAKHQLLEIENDLIAAHIIQTGDIPDAQFLG